MNWWANVLRSAGGRRGAESALSAADDEGECLDTALRRAMRAGVAGAAPRSDAWLRLQKRIQEESASAPWLSQQAPHAPLQAVGARWSAFSTVFLPRFTQLGAALMLLLLLLGDLGAFGNLAAPGPTRQTLQSVSDSGSDALPPSEHVNRALVILADPAPSGARVVAPEPAAPADLVPPPGVRARRVEEAAAETPVDDTAAAPTLLPDGGDWRHEVASTAAPPAADDSVPQGPRTPRTLQPR